KDAYEERRRGLLPPVGPADWRHRDKRFHLRRAALRNARCVVRGGGGGKKQRRHKPLVVAGIADGGYPRHAADGGGARRDARHPGSQPAAPEPQAAASEQTEARSAAGRAGAAGTRRVLPTEQV